MIAPTERSMPAVRMTSVCAAPTMPVIATCWRISDSENGEKNFEPRIDAEDQRPTTPARSAAPAPDWNAACAGGARAAACRARSKEATSVALSFRTFSNSCRSAWVLASAIGVLSTYGRPDRPGRFGRGGPAGPPRVRSRLGASAPALLEAGLGVDRLDAFDRLVGDEHGAGVDEGLALGRIAGFSPVSANFLIASMPIDAISSGYCCEVAPMTPSATFLTPGQPPSTETISTSFSLPTAFSAS